MNVGELVILTTGVAPAVTDMFPVPVADRRPVLEIVCPTILIPVPAAYVGAGVGADTLTVGFDAVPPMVTFELPEVTPKTPVLEMTKDPAEGVATAIPEPAVTETGAAVLDALMMAFAAVPVIVTLEPAVSVDTQLVLERSSGPAAAPTHVPGVKVLSNSDPTTVIPEKVGLFTIPTVAVLPEFVTVMLPEPATVVLPPFTPAPMTLETPPLAEIVTVAVPEPEGTTSNAAAPPPVQSKVPVDMLEDTSVTL